MYGTEKGLAIVACCQDEVVGLVTICDVVDLAMLQANYELSSLINMSHHPPERHAEIDILCINPIFAHRWVGTAGCVPTVEREGANG